MKRRSACFAGIAAVVVVIVAGCSKTTDDPRVVDEIARRKTYAQSLLCDGGVEAGARAYGVGPNDDIQYVDGFTNVQFDPPDDWRSHAFRWMSQKGRVRLRTRGGDTPMHLSVKGWVNEKVLDTRPKVRLYLDGAPVFPKLPEVDDNQLFIFDVEVDPALLRGREWVNLDIVSSAVAWHWAEIPELKVIVVFELGWSPVP